ncbi:MAG TPA: choline dehydrogenase [Stellaceae bacterium]
MANYDYVIVGAGSAGCVLANRLSADPAVAVLVLEAGARDNKMILKMPLAFVPASQRREFNWGYESEPDPTLNNRRLRVPRGKVLGGSSSINGMMYARGHARDFDHWRQLGNDGWSYADILPYYKRMESDWRGAGVYHGGDGPLATVPSGSDHPLYGAFMAGATAAGFAESRDLNGAEPEGFGPMDFNQHKGHRASSAAAYLTPVLGRRNLTVETGAMTRRVMIDNGRAIGVEYRRDGKSHVAHAAREVILSGGTYNSPQLLMLSGIGPADDLTTHGIKPVLDLPGVGRNLQEHPSMWIRRLCKVPTGYDANFRFDRLAREVVRWRLNGTGVMAGLPLLCVGFIRTRPELERPDMQCYVNCIGFDTRIWFPGVRKANGDKIDWINSLLHPESRGYMTLRSADPLAPPRIQFNLLSSRNDLVTMREAVKIARDLMARPPFADAMGAEVMPGPKVKTDAEIEDAIRNFCGTTQHPVGTCAMGTGRDAVVDAQLRVRGIDCLRVVDASVMPAITGGNTNAPTIMIAEKASDMILGKPPLPEAEGLEKAA